MNSWADNRCLDDMFFLLFLARWYWCQVWLSCAILLSTRWDVMQVYNTSSISLRRRSLSAFVIQHKGNTSSVVPSAVSKTPKNSIWQIKLTWQRAVKLSRHWYHNVASRLHKYPLRFSSFSLFFLYTIFFLDQTPEMIIRASGCTCELIYNPCNDNLYEGAVKIHPRPSGGILIKSNCGLAFEYTVCLPNNPPSSGHER